MQILPRRARCRTLGCDRKTALSESDGRERGRGTSRLLPSVLAAVSSSRFHTNTVHYDQEDETTKHVAICDGHASFDAERERLRDLTQSRGPLSAASNLPRKKCGHCRCDKWQYLKVSQNSVSRVSFHKRHFSTNCEREREKCRRRSAGRVGRGDGGRKITSTVDCSHSPVSLASPAV